MKLIAQQGLQIAPEDLRVADAIITDEASKGMIDFGERQGIAKILIAEGKHLDDKDWYVRETVGSAILMGVSAGFETMLVVSPTLFSTAVSAYHAEMR